MGDHYDLDYSIMRITERTVYPHTIHTQDDHSTSYQNHHT